MKDDSSFIIPSNKYNYMRNHFFILICLLALITGCDKKSDTVFSETPDQRLAKTLSELEAQLIGGQYGWVGNWSQNQVRHFISTLFLRRIIELRCFLILMRPLLLF
jgi:hypothetical protein